MNATVRGGVLTRGTMSRTVKHDLDPPSSQSLVDGQTLTIICSVITVRVIAAQVKYVSDSRGPIS